MKDLVLASRILLAAVLLLDLPVLIEVLIHLVTGGLRSVDGWIVHIALTGKPWLGATIAEQHAWIAQAYRVLAIMLVAPIALYLFQRWLSSRSDPRNFKV